MRIGMVVVALIVVMQGAVPTALAQKRVALVIGNSAYQHTTKLTNPKNDAIDMVAALTKARLSGHRRFRSRQSGVRAKST